MPEPDRDLSTLPIDEDVEGVLDEVASPQYEGFTDERKQEADTRVRSLKRDEARWLYGIARAFLALKRQDEALQEQLTAVAAEIADVRERLGSRLNWLDMELEDAARRHRESGLGNSLTVGGVGVWNTRKINAHWAIDNAKVIDALEADDRARFTYEEEPKPPVRKLRGPEFRQHLDEQLATDMAVDPHADDDVRGAAGAIAGNYPEGAVSYVPEQINVSYDLNT